MDLSALERKLTDAEIKTARLDVLAIFEHVLKIDKVHILAGDFKATNSQERKIKMLVELRAKRSPLAYLLGHKEFYGRDFFVDERVLIPRPESEDMIELLKKQVSPRSKDVYIFDIGTGSGCLAISAKLELTDSGVTGLDVSESALEVAKKNAAALGANISLKHFDLFESSLASVLDLQTSAYLMANLPYVPQKLVTSVEITNEPKIALFSGKDGLNHYRKFWQQIAELDQPKIRLHIITECLAEQFDQLDELAENAGFKLFSFSGLARYYQAAD